MTQLEFAGVLLGLAGMAAGYAGAWAAAHYKAWPACVALIGVGTGLGLFVTTNLATNVMAQYPDWVINAPLYVGLALVVVGGAIKASMILGFVDTNTIVLIEPGPIAAPAIASHEVIDGELVD